MRRRIADCPICRDDTDAELIQPRFEEFIESAERFKETVERPTELVETPSELGSSIIERIAMAILRSFIRNHEFVCLKGEVPPLRIRVIDEFHLISEGPGE